MCQLISPTAKTKASMLSRTSSTLVAMQPPCSQDRHLLPATSASQFGLAFKKIASASSRPLKNLFDVRFHRLTVS
jgi:hypothetical protein